MSWKSTVIEGARRSGALRVVGASWGLRRLTVLCYHRVTVYPSAGFDVFPGTVSASPGGFARQMDIVADRFNVIGMDRLVAWLDGSADLPRRPALITFDDGYADNYHQAFPVLRARSLPATVFLTTGLIGTGSPAWWDLVAHAFHHSTAVSGVLPVVGRADWSPGVVRDRLVARMIEGLKALPEADKLAAIDDLVEILDAEPPAGAFADLYLTWDQVREMESAGFCAAAHTRTHPVLTRLDEDGMQAEVAGSIERVATEVGRPVTAFAYPNGMPGDYDEVTMRMLADAGIGAAFTLSPGPARASEVAADPLRIRRVYIQARHDRAAFEVRLEGVTRLATAVSGRRRVRLRVPGRA